jgi:hypothetical protein
MKKYTAQILVLIYAVLALSAFGHSAASYKCDENISKTRCTEVKASGGMLAAIGAPFYLSWLIFEDNPSPDKE